MISVVVPTCRRPDLLARCLDRLAPGVQTLPADRYEVIVTDDGEPTVEQLVADKYPWATWAAGPRRGPAANRNSGVRHARGEWVAFTDDDCVPDPGWLAGFAAAVRPGCDVYEGKTTCRDGIPSPLYHAPANETGGYLWSCNMMVRKALFEALGGFDESFPHAAMEDVDFRERLIAAGRPFDFVPGAAVDHPSRPVQTGRQLGRTHESGAYYWYKSGRRGFFTPGMFYRLFRRRLATIKASGLGLDAVRLAASLASELWYLAPRLPWWELKYRWKSYPKAGLSCGIDHPSRIVTP